MPTLKEQTGGYYAIKGFTYQFDKSLFEILANPHSTVEIEQIQDIGIDNYYIQVKYKETQVYAPSKIRAAVIQLLKYFLLDKKKKFKLYCYFKDKAPHTINLLPGELETILGITSGSYNDSDKKQFIKNFSIEFSEDFEGQFKKLIQAIKSSFNLTTIEEATVYHATFRSKLIGIAIKKKDSDRVMDFKSLKVLVLKTEKIVFELAHYKYLKNEKYTTYLRKEYFTFKKLNTPNKERLFVLEIDSFIKDAELIELVSNIKSRFYKKDTSPAPYICFYGIQNERLIQLKQKLWDKKLHFNDGTHFCEDKFRIDDLVSDLNSYSNFTFKIINPGELNNLYQRKVVDEWFAFFTEKNDQLIAGFENVNEFYISQTKDITKIIKP